MHVAIVCKYFAYLVCFLRFAVESGAGGSRVANGDGGATAASGAGGAVGAAGSVGEYCEVDRQRIKVCLPRETAIIVYVHAVRCDFGYVGDVAALAMRCVGCVCYVRAHLYYTYISYMFFGVSSYFIDINTIQFRK